MMVNVALESVGDYDEGVSFDKCEACREKLRASNVIDSVQALNWMSVDEIDLRRVVGVHVCVYIYYVTTHVKKSLFSSIF